MDEEIFNKKLRELISKITDLPEVQQKKLASLINETKDRHAEIKANVSKVTESLIALRICVQYMLLDIEATRRERDTYKKQLNDLQNQTDSEM